LDPSLTFSKLSNESDKFLRLGFPVKVRGKGVSLMGPEIGGSLVCRRCGRQVSWIEAKKKGDQVYYYAVHYSGYVKDSSGKIRKKVTKCYLGPQEYVYVSKLHENLGLTLRGAIDSGRASQYLKVLKEYAKGVEIEIGGEVCSGSYRDIIKSAIKEYLKKAVNEEELKERVAEVRGFLNTLYYRLKSMDYEKALEW